MERRRLIWTTSRACSTRGGDLAAEFRVLRAGTAILPPAPVAGRTSRILTDHGCPADRGRALLRQPDRAPRLCSCSYRDPTGQPHEAINRAIYISSPTWDTNELLLVLRRPRSAGPPVSENARIRTSSSRLQHTPAGVAAARERPLVRSADGAIPG